MATRFIRRPEAPRITVNTESAEITSEKENLEQQLHLLEAQLQQLEASLEQSALTAAQHEMMAIIEQITERYMGTELHGEDFRDLSQAIESLNRKIDELKHDPAIRKIILGIRDCRQKIALLSQRLAVYDKKPLDE